MGSPFTGSRLAGAALALTVVTVPLIVPTAALADPTQKEVVTVDCQGVGTLQIEGLPNNAAAAQVVGSPLYRTFVVHWYQITDSAGAVVATVANGTEGNVGPLYTCTSQQGGDTVTILAQLV